MNSCWTGGGPRPSHRAYIGAVSTPEPAPFDRSAMLDRLRDEEQHGKNDDGEADAEQRKLNLGVVQQLQPDARLFGRA